MAKIKKCLDCKKPCSSKAKRCKSCNTKQQHKLGKFGIMPCGKKHWSWQGGKIKVNGYIMIRSPQHPNVYGNTYFPEHRLVMEKYLNRYLTSEELVHHINGIRTDNRLENLMLVTKKTHPIDNFKWRIELQKRIRYLERKILKLQERNE